MRNIVNRKKYIYFASDVHLGAPSISNHKEHEMRFVAWLDSIKESAAEIYLLGDVFDFWFEYKKVVPRGFTRFLGKLAEITDSGIPVHFFTGNHDIWVFDYLPKETGVKVYRKPLDIVLGGKRFFLAHGDGLGHYDPKFNFMKAVFTNRFAQWLFGHVHPNMGIALAAFWSGKSREKNLTKYGSHFLGEDKEWLVLYAKEVLKREHFDYFVFGHRHVALNLKLDSNSRLVYLGDWVKHFTYGVWDGEDFKLERFCAADDETHREVNC
jgi:UDP-2,3-diacylglucosamine hydrolase